MYLDNLHSRGSSSTLLFVYWFVGQDLLNKGTGQKIDFNHKNFNLNPRAVPSSVTLSGMTYTLSKTSELFP